MGKKSKPKVEKVNATPDLKPVQREEDRIYSHPTMCLRCHLIVVMSHERGVDPLTGAWECPRCGHKYLFSLWKIKKRAQQREVG